MRSSDIARFGDVPHPRCPTCGLAMWLVEINHQQNKALDDCTFECKVCEARKTVRVESDQPDQR